MSVSQHVELEINNDNTEIVNADRCNPRHVELIMTSTTTLTDTTLNNNNFQQPNATPSITHPTSNKKY